MWSYTAFPQGIKRASAGHPASCRPASLGCRRIQPFAELRVKEFSRDISGPLPSPPELQLAVVTTGYPRRWCAVGWEQKEELGSKKANLEKNFRGHTPPNVVGDGVGTS